MRDEPTTCDCSRWKVTLPERRVDFTSVCACAERCDCLARGGVRVTLATLAVFIAVGALFGGLGAHRENSENLATLRDTHLRSLDSGGRP